jgi:hypothetical protein
MTDCVIGMKTCPSRQIELNKQKFILFGLIFYYLKKTISSLNSKNYR